MHKPTILHAIREFIVDRRSLHCKPRTIQFYQSNLTRFASVSGDIPVDEALKRGQIRRFFVVLHEQQVSQDTFAAYDRALRTFIRFCRREKWIKGDPMAGRKRLQQNRNKLPDTLSPDEIRAMLDTCDDSDVGMRDRAIMLMLLDTGMRAGELCELTADRLRCYPVGGRISIPAALSKGTQDRVVMFSRVTAGALYDWLGRRGSPGGHGYIFLAVSGRRTLTDRSLTPGGLNQMIRRRAQLAGVTGHKRLCHIWRHTMAKLFVTQGGDLESLRLLLGHSSLETVRIYLRFTTDELEDLHRRRSPVRSLHLEAQKETPVTFVTGVEGADTASDGSSDRLQMSHVLN